MGRWMGGYYCAYSFLPYVLFFYYYLVGIPDPGIFFLVCGWKEGRVLLDGDDEILIPYTNGRFYNRYLLYLSY